MTRSLPRTLAVAALALALLAPTSRAQGLDLQELGEAFLKLHCGRKAEPGSCSLEEIVERDFVHLRLGAFDLAVPAIDLADTDLAENFRAIAVGLLDLQDRFSRWQELPEEVRRILDEDIAKLRAWVGGWTTPTLARLARADSKDMLTALEVSQDIRDATERLRGTTSGELAQVLAPQWVGGVSIVLCPKRREFMEVMGFLGLDDAEWRAQHWIEGADQWTQVWKGPNLILALEYAPWTEVDPGYHTSMDPKRLDPDGVLQHALNQAARALLFRVLNRDDMEHFTRALSAMLVVETVGKIAVLDGEGQIRTTGATTMPYERFVPGGLSEGGVLPAIPAGPLDKFAACRWRDSKGQDHFIGVLRSGQKDGAKGAAKDKKNKKSKDKRAHFELAGDDGEATYVVTAPFLSALATEQPYPPPSYLNDYREFFKAYQAGFWYWVRSEAVEGDAALSARRFEEFVKALAAAGEDGQAVSEPLETTVERIYSVPLSGVDGSVDSLEWRFLEWLSKQK
jgi:hypothetical protein